VIGGLVAFLLLRKRGKGAKGSGPGAPSQRTGADQGTGADRLS